jgi:hypothetical protein
MKYTESLMVGKRFSRLVIISFGGRDKSKNRYWICKCDCGAEKKIRQQNLLNKLTKSCGCLYAEGNTTHGKSKLRGAYCSWQQMKDRCFNPNNKRYSSYGGRGVTVCKRWLQFENFLKDMGDRPGPGYSIDRIDTFGSYSPKNCRWATSTVQSRNRRNTIYVNFKGIRYAFTELCEISGIRGSNAIKRCRRRLKRGWKVEDIIKEEERFDGEY